MVRVSSQPVLLQVVSQAFVQAWEKWAGRQYAGMNSPLRSAFLEDVLRRAKRALTGLERSLRPDDLERCKQLRVAVSQMEEMKKEWQTWQL